MPGQPGEYTAGIPKEYKALAELINAQVMSGMQRGATPYTGPLGSSADPAQIAGMNMRMGLAGQGKYSRPGMYSLPNVPNMANAFGANQSGYNPVVPINPVNPDPNKPGPKPPPIEFIPKPGERTVPGLPPELPPNPRIRRPAPAPPPWTPPKVPGAPPGPGGGGGSGSSPMNGMDPQALFQLISAMRGMR